MQDLESLLFLRTVSIHFVVLGQVNHVGKFLFSLDIVVQVNSLLDLSLNFSGWSSRVFSYQSLTTS